MRIWLLVALLAFAACAHAQTSARVMVVGTYHFANPGQDLHNVEAVDVLTPQRQLELQAITDALAAFEPTYVAVEWPAALAEERYAAYRAGTLAPSPNEVVQLGFRLAQQRGLARVHGIDVEGEFPFAPVQDWARVNGRADALGALLDAAGAMVKRTQALQARGIASALTYMNSPTTIAHANRFYAELVRFGSADEQPGVALLAAWEKRNLEICARLVQSLEAGDRAVVFYGQGHAHLLRRCIRETPGLELVEAIEYLPHE